MLLPVFDEVILEWLHEEGDRNASLLPVLYFLSTEFVVQKQERAEYPHLKLEQIHPILGAS
jgi:hypothetical protein